LTSQYQGINRIGIEQPAERGAAVRQAPSRHELADTGGGHAKAMGRLGGGIDTTYGGEHAMLQRGAGKVWLNLGTPSLGRVSIVGCMFVVASSWPDVFVSAWTQVFVAIAAPGFAAPVMLLAGTREPIRESLPDSRELAAPLGLGTPAGRRLLRIV
jgi:hypothetical protein